MTVLTPQGEGLQTSTLIGTFGDGWQFENGSPVYPSEHEQTGIWFTTSHTAESPQVPIQGSTHLLRMHALFRAHSALFVHSGRHPFGSYGFPWYSAMHRHSCVNELHSVFNPHGLVLQKSVCFGSSSIITFGWHFTNGSPSKPSLHVQIGTWFNTWQSEEENVGIEYKINRYELNIATLTCIKATRSRAWILTPLLNACLLTRTLRIRNTFWSTFWWISNEIFQTWTYWTAANHFTHWIWIWKLQ